MVGAKLMIVIVVDQVGAGLERHAAAQAEQEGQRRDAAHSRAQAPPTRIGMTLAVNENGRVARYQITGGWAAGRGRRRWRCRQTSLMAR